MGVSRAKRRGKSSSSSSSSPQRARSPKRKCRSSGFDSKELVAEAERMDFRSYAPDEIPVKDNVVGRLLGVGGGNLRLIEHHLGGKPYVHIQILNKKTGARGGFQTVQCSGFRKEEAKAVVRKLIDMINASPRSSVTDS